MTRKILFTGYYGFKNFGDDLFGLACVQGLRQISSKYEAVLLAPPIKNIEAKFLVPRFLANLYRSKTLFGKLTRLFFMVYGCLRYRELVLSGGSVLGSEFSFLRRAQYMLVSRRMCTISAIGVSVGPFKTEGDRVKFGQFINKFDYLAVRDLASVEECKGLGINVESKMFNDLAGCVDMQRKVVANEKIIGVSVCKYESLYGGDEEIEKTRNDALFRGIAEFSKKHHYRVDILILNADEGVGDSEISNSLYVFLQKEGCATRIVNYSDPKKTLNDISRCATFLSVRLHGAICAYLKGVPFLHVEYHRKCKDFLDSVGYSSMDRIPASLNEANRLVELLEKTISDGIRVDISPQEYQEKAQEIFSRSPWVGK